MADAGETAAAFSYKPLYLQVRDSLVRRLINGTWQPGQLIRLYSVRWGISIGRASERLKAVPASASDAKQLGCPPSAPLLEISRVAFDLENRPVELRVSRCLTDGFHYSSELR